VQRYKTENVNCRFSPPSAAFRRLFITFTAANGLKPNAAAKVCH
jgi:hypothetical protein